MAFVSPLGIGVTCRTKVLKRGRCITRASATNDTSLTRRTMLQAGAVALLASPAVSISEEVTKQSPSDAEITDKVYLDVKVAGLPAGRITVGLFGSDAPKSVEWFKTSVGTGLRGKAGLTAGYRGSVGTRVSVGRFVELGRVKQIDAINQSPGTPQRQQRQILPPETRESNQFTHDARGLVSVKRGGGAFEFSVTLAPCAELDSANMVIGKVLDGDEVLDKLAKVPTNKKTVRDGFRNVGKAIGDARAKVDVRDAESVSGLAPARVFVVAFTNSPSRACVYAMRSTRSQLIAGRKAALVGATEAKVEIINEASISANNRIGTHIDIEVGILFLTAYHPSLTNLAL